MRPNFNTLFQSHMTSSLRQLRLALGLSQKQLAGLFNVTPTTVRLWEEGISEPRLDALMGCAGLAAELLNAVALASDYRGFLYIGDLSENFQEIAIFLVKLLRSKSSS